MQPLEVVINGWPIIPIILGLVELSKRFGLKGNILIAVSTLLGVAIGSGYYLSVQIPANYSEWFTLVIGALGYGLVASGIYDVLNKPKV